MATPEVIGLAPEGDVVLICGSEAGKEIQVSSVVLGLASPVFKAMFSRKFKEGNQLALTGSIEMPMPDDDASGMFVICQVLHFQRLQGPFSLGELLKIADLADKYDCSHAVGLAATPWVKLEMDHFFRAQTERILATPPTSDLQQLMKMAMLFQQDDLVKEIGTKLALHNEGRLSIQINDRSDIFVKAIAYIETQRSTATLDVDSWIEGRIANEQYRVNRNLLCTRSCSFKAQHGRAFLNLFQQNDLWPVTDLLNKKLVGTLQAMRAIAVSSVQPCAPFGCGWGDVLFEAARAADAIEKAIVPLCLDCLHSENKTCNEHELLDSSSRDSDDGD